MSLPYAASKITLSCPLYAADFDPQNQGFLLVGGGGGEGRSGVGNKIVLLNASKKYELSEVVELGLSRDEDSVTSLAFAKTTELWASAFAGINSSMREQQIGSNKHLRSFLLQYPSRKKAAAAGAEATEEKNVDYEPKAQALGQTSYFTPATGSNPETFQRLLRLSKQYTSNAPRLGAVATGLAPEGEIVTFVADTNKPTENDIRHRIQLGRKGEAADLDIIAYPETDSQGGETAFFMAYCTEYDVWTTKCYYKYDRPQNLDPQCIHSTPHPDVFASTKLRPRFRSLRFLTPTLLLILQNMPSGKGSELVLMDTGGAILLRKRLHKKIKSGTALTVSALPYSTPGPRPMKRIQQAIAVAGADNSVTILTLDHCLSRPYRNLKFQQRLFLPNVHPTSITSLTFSTHQPPTTSGSQTPPQYLKLASTSIANTVVVHTFPLTPYPERKKHTDSPASYVLSVPGAATARAKETAFSLLVASLVLALVSFCLQSFLEVKHGTREVIGARTWLQKPWEERLPTPKSMPWLQEKLRQLPVLRADVKESTVGSAEPPLETFYGAMPPSGDATFATDPAADSTPGLRELLKSRASSPSSEDHHIYVHQPATVLDNAGEPQSANTPQKLQLMLHHSKDTETGRKGAKKWEDLSHEEREGWKERLLDAGEWAVEEGENVLKGIFFSGLAQGLGAMLG